MTTDDRIDISIHTNALCETLGLEPRLVRTMTIEPRTITAEVYLTTENGSKFLLKAGTPDASPATENRTWKVIT